MEVFFRQVQWGDCVWGRPPCSLPPHPTPWGLLCEGHAPCPHVHVLPNHGSKFILMLIEIKLAVHFIGSKGCICSLEGGLTLSISIERWHEWSFYHHLSAASTGFTQL